MQYEAWSDSRGYFAEVFKRSSLHAAGIDLDIAQENVSLSAQTGTIRGLHFQVSPRSQAKLVRVLRGAVFDVAVDLRIGSPTYGRWAATTLAHDQFQALYIPHGFAHGFCTLAPETVVQYSVDREYSAEHDCGVQWNDPDIGIDWPAAGSAPTLSDRDRALPRLTELPPYFFHAPDGQDHP